jgi:hypothetical protein
VALFYVNRLPANRPVDWILAVRAVNARADPSLPGDVLAVPAEEDADGFGKSCEHCLLTD